MCFIILKKSINKNDFLNIKIENVLSYYSTGAIHLQIYRYAVYTIRIKEHSSITSKYSKEYSQHHEHSPRTFSKNIILNNIYDIMNILEEISSTSQSNPDMSPSPLTAEHPNIVQCLPAMSGPEGRERVRERERGRGDVCVSGGGSE